MVGDASVLGKDVGRDERQDKVTYPALLGVDASRQRAVELMRRGIGALDDFGPPAGCLRQIAEYIVVRQM